MNRIISTLLLLFITLYGNAQAHDTIPASRQDSAKVAKYLSIVTGYYYYGRSAVEIGLGTKTESSGGRHPASAGCYMSSEFFYSKSLFIAPKIGAWLTGGASGINLGISTLYYTNFKTGSLQLRPEIGTGFSGLRIYYGRNMRLTNTSFNSAGKNLLGINILLDVKKRVEKNISLQRRY